MLILNLLVTRLLMEFLVEVFEPFKEGIRLVQEMTISDIHGLYAIGEVGKFYLEILFLSACVNVSNKLIV